MIALIWAFVAAGQDVANGEYLVRGAGCVACHTAEGGTPFAGGYPLETRWGTFVGSNLTPDPETGIGTWSEADFLHAVRMGKAPDGHAYWPGFPYVSFTRITDDDLRDIFAYLRTLEPVVRAEEPHETRYHPKGLGSWRVLSFEPGPFEADPEHDAEWNRGAYLVRAIGHCEQCHTPRDLIGGLRRGRELAGSTRPPDEAPNLTPHADGLSGWTLDGFETLFTSGMKPDGDFVEGVMADIVSDQTAVLTPEDRRAIAVYLMALTPRPTR